MTESAPEEKLAPPVLIYLPGKSGLPFNSASRVAELMAIKASKGVGTFAAEDGPRPGRHFTECRRIVRAGSGPVLDVCTVDYRPLMQGSDVSGAGAGPTLRRLAFSITYLFRALALVLPARTRAKETVAKWQLVLGLGAVVILFLSVLFTAAAVLAALGVWEDTSVAGDAADAIALGATAFTTWLIVRVRPAVRDATATLQQLLDYAQDERHAASVAGCLGDALDDVLEVDPDRTIHILGYSFGSLIALDYLYPRRAMRETLDPRHAKAITTVATVGCPMDFVRLYVPDYAEDREARVPDIEWTNVFIAADVFGSNFIDGDDFVESAPTPAAGLQPEAGGRRAQHRPTEITLAGTRPNSMRYTDEVLTPRSIWGRRGFLSHGGYWDEPERENCLHLVTPALG